MCSQEQASVSVMLNNSFKDGVIDLTAGTAGGVANVYAGQPLDTVKVKMQTFPHLYNNWMKCFWKTFRLDGLRGLYAGSVPALAANISENAVLFAAYGYCQKVVALLANRQNVTEMSPVENALSGSLAAFFAALALCPTELVKCRLQAHHETNPNVKCTSFSICRDLYRDRGIRSFYVGMTPTLAREVPGYFCFFGAYETCRHLFTSPEMSRDELGMLPTAVSGAVGGIALWTVAYPFDVIKSRMQVSGTGKFLPMLFNVLKKEGVLALYRGLSPTLLRTCSASSCLFVAYENTKSFLHNNL